MDAYGVEARLMDCIPGQHRTPAQLSKCSGGVLQFPDALFLLYSIFLGKTTGRALEFAYPMLGDELGEE